MLSKKEQKRLYDIEYRRKNKDKIKIRKAEYHKKTYNPETERIKRKKRMPAHVEYCRQPEYKNKKKKYDHDYLFKKKYGEYWECMQIANEIQKIFEKQVPDSYERAKIRGTIKRQIARNKIRRQLRAQLIKG